MNLIYERPDYAAIAKRLGALNEQILAAASFEPLHAAWLAAKAEIEAMEYREEIVYVRHLCGLDYENSTEEVLLQSREDPAIYALRDRCNRNAMQSAFAPALSRLYGAQVFASLDEAIDRDSSDTLRLQTEESVLKTEYRRLMKNRDRDEDRLFEVFAALIETRSALASCAGYGDYIELGYQKINRRDYGRDELARFRGQIQKTVTPFMAAIKKRGAEQIGLPARAGKPVELIDEIRTMFHDLSEETGCFIDDVTQNEMYDLEIRENKCRPLWICCMFPKIKLPFVVGTFSGDGMDTGAAVHEFGHGFAFYTAARSQPLYEYHRASPAVNEIHSKAMEAFQYPYLELFVGDRKRDYIRNHLLRELDNMAYRCAVDEFEHRLYSLPGRTRTQICALWAEISQTYRPWVPIDPEAGSKGLCWPRQTHIVERPFYYIEYDIAQICAWSLHRSMRADRKKAWENYRKLCCAGGSKAFFELLAEAELPNPFSEEVIAGICTAIAEELEAVL